MNFKALVIILLSSNILGQVSSKVLPLTEPLSIPISNNLARKNIVQGRNYLVQKDPWSCGIRALFHMLAVEKALKSPDNFEEALKKNLQNKNELKRLYFFWQKNAGYLNSFLKKILIWNRKHPAVNVYDMLNVAELKGLEKKLICLDLANNEINLLGFKIFHHIWRGTKNPAKSEMHRLTHIAKREPKAIYVIANVGEHAVLFAIVNLPNEPATLYVFDSAEQTLKYRLKPENYKKFEHISKLILRNIKKIIKFLTPYVEKLNVSKQKSIATNLPYFRNFLLIPKNSKLQKHD